MDRTMTLSRAENLGGVDRPFYIGERLMPSPTMSDSTIGEINVTRFHTGRFTAELADSNATKPLVPISSRASSLPFITHSFSSEQAIWLCYLTEQSGLPNASPFHM